MRFMIAAGGTGGHIVPALAVADELRTIDPAAQVIFIGTGKPLEEKLVIGAGYRLESLAARPFAGRGLKGKLQLAASLPQGLRSARALVRTIDPHAAIGFGGYPSFLPIVAAWMHGIPCVIDEQNAHPGIANRVLSIIARRVFAVPGATAFFRTSRLEHVPNPVRRQFLDIPDWAPPGDGQRWTVLVVGGSQGAVSLNRAVISALGAFREAGARIVHQSGETDLLPLTELYRQADFRDVRVVPFIDAIADEYRAAHLVICRAGAMTAAEVSAAGRPAIFVPLTIAGGHQTHNVAHLVNGGAALMLSQNEELGVRLAVTLAELFSAPERLQEMSRRAREMSRVGEHGSARRIAEAIREVARREGT